MRRPSPGLEGESEPPASTGLREFEEQTALGELYLGALMQRQWRLSLGLALSFVGFLAVQPLLAWMWPTWGRLRLLGIPLAWIVLAVGSYFVLVWLGWLYVRRAGEVDDEFTDLLR